MNEEQHLPALYPHLILAPCKLMCRARLSGGALRLHKQCPPRKAEGALDPIGRLTSIVVAARLHMSEGLYQKVV